MRRLFVILALAPSLTAGQAAPREAAATTKRFDFTIANMMRGPEVYGRPPQNVRWTADGRWIYFQWNEPGTDWREPVHTYRVRAESGARPERVSDAAADSAAPSLERGTRSADGRWRAVESQGDLWLYDERTGASRRITETLAAEGSPVFAADARQLFFVRENNVYAFDLASGGVRQLTDVRAGPEPRDSARAAGQRGFLERQQRELLESVRDQLRADSIRKAEQKAREALRVKPLYLNAGERVERVSVSPNGRALLVLTSTTASGARQTEVPQYVTSSGYTEELRVRTKVGDAQTTGRVAFVSLPSGASKWLRVIPTDTTRPPAPAIAAGWSPDGQTGLLVATSRDWKARFLHAVSADSGALTTLDVLRDTAWVGGPCGGCAGWTADGRAWFVSEADGYAHLYSVAARGGDRRQLTSGRWEVLGVELSRDRRAFYLTTSEASPFEQHLYTMPAAGGPRTRITTRPGGHAPAVSPDGEWVADVFSEANRPPELFLLRNRPGAPMAQLTTSPTAEWLAHPWIKPEIVMIPASDGAQVPGRIYRPQDVGAMPNGAAVIFVHGAGYLHNVHRWWSTYAREYMFHHLLATRGYVVLDLDYRASAGYGRDWRTAIYRHMGGRDLQDHVDGVRYLQRQFG
ncbi:MAG: DPP IV N-terminal domain-containing protein, partial [Gemmatimonadaceae bacterium]